MSEQRAPLRPRISVGTTPRFEGPHLSVEATLPAPPQWPVLLEGSLRAARSIAAAVAGGERLAQAARLVQRDERRADPWSAWLNAFAALHAVPGWSVQPEAGDGADVRLRIRCLYAQAVAHWAQLALDLLIIADQARDRPVRIARGRWAARLAGLAAGLPAPETMALHAALSARRLPWRWMGGDRTTVGLGSAQRTISGTAPDPERAADRLAEAKLSIPLYTVTGSVGKTTTTRLLAQLLETTGLRLGMTASDGAWAAGVRLAKGDRIGGMNALMVAWRRDVDAMVAELGRRGLFYSGVPFESSDVAILLNVDDVHIGEEGVHTVAAMADVKGLTLRPARLAVLNRDDANCVRLGAGRAPESCVWFSRIADEDALRALSREAGGALGVSRTAKGKPRALTIWSGGEQVRALPLDGVTPYHGMLGEKTLEELLAAVAAAWFGPVRIEEWDDLLTRLRLDSANHAFRTSLHRNGDLVFLLDKASEPPQLVLLGEAIRHVCAREGVERRIAVFTRTPKLAFEQHRISCERLHPMADEFVCFDVPEAYASPIALPEYAPGSVPHLLRAELERLNLCAGVDKPIHAMANWAETEAWLRARLAAADGPTLVLVNQPSTAEAELDRRILDFANAPLG